jgi:hypothetical protein
VAYSEFRTVDFGRAFTGSTAVAYSIANHSGTFTAWSTAGVAEIIANSGSYGATVSLDDNFQGWILWRTDAGGSAYAQEDINSPLQPFDRGTVQASPAPSTTAFAGGASLSANNSAYTGYCAFTSGALAGQARLVQSYTGASKLVVTDAFDAAPSAGDSFILIAG